MKHTLGDPKELIDEVLMTSGLTHTIEACGLEKEDIGVICQDGVGIIKTQDLDKTVTLLFDVRHNEIRRCSISLVHPKTEKRIREETLKAIS